MLVEIVLWFIKIQNYPYSYLKPKALKFKALLISFVKPNTFS